MKLSELKNHFKNQYVIRIVAGVLIVALAGGGIVAGADRREANAAVSTEAEESDGDSSDSGITLEDMVTRSESDVDKEETVYLLTDANGAVNETIAVEHLYNNEGAETIEDQTKLSDITNVKGRETFEQNGEELTWQAGGNDIYYRGTLEGEPPVSQKVTYYLDGGEISPQDLAGKSGRVTIHYDYENKSTYTASVKGEDVTVSVPFAAVTALMLEDNFSNIEVTNGKVKQNGTTSVVIGCALPGLKDSLDVEENEFSGDVNLPDYFEVSADVENFSLETAMTLVMNATELTEVSGLDTSSLDDKIEELEDASGQLEDGSGDLADGLGTLKDSLGSFTDGMKSLSDGLSSYTDGADRLNDGIGQIQEGVDTLDGSKKTLSDGVKELKKGAGSAADGAGQLVAGYKGDGTKKNPGLVKGTKSLADGAKKLEAGIGQAAAGFLGDGTEKNPGLVKGAQAVAQGASQLDKGVKTMAGSLQEMQTELSQSAEGILAKLNTEQNKALLGQLKASYADGVTVQNISAVTADVAAGKQKLTAVIQMSTRCSEEQAVTQYEALYAGLSQAQGALSVIAQVTGGLEDSSDDIQALVTGSGQLSAAAASVSDGAGKLSAGVSQLKDGSEELSDGASTVYAGAKKLSKGTSQLSSGLGKLDSGLGSLNDKVPELVKGIGALKTGVDQLADGSDTLVSNNTELLGGMKQLLTGTGDIVDGVDQLADGSDELADGMAQFNEEAIDQLVNTYNGDVKNLADRIQAVLDAGKDYQTYSGLADGQTGSVKFIYRQEAVKRSDK